MRITQWEEYAAQFCIYIAKQESDRRATVSASEIATSLGVDTLYAQQILQRLRRGKIIESVRGAQGGYRLQRSSDEITLKDILVASEGYTFEPLCQTRPICDQKCSTSNHCGLRGVWYELRGHIDVFLIGKTLKHLLDLDSEIVPLTTRSPEQELEVDGIVANSVTPSLSPVDN